MKTKLLTIQSFRGIAAMLVVLFHLAPTTLKYFHYLSFNDVFSFGWMGVDFFFVLSGFIITYIHYNDIQQPKGNWGTFLKKRFIRIFPIYWFVLTLMFLIYIFLMKGQVHDEFVFNVHSPAHWFYLFRQYLLLPGDDYLVGVAWSLSFELLFYLVFAVCIITGLKVARTVGILWFLLIVVKYFTNTPILPGFLFSTCIVEFLIGCVIGYMIKAGKFFNLKRAYPLFLFILVEGLIIYFDGHSFERLGLFEKLFLGSISALIIWIAVTADTFGKYSILKNKVLTLIGDASYSIYLIHPIFLSMLCRVLAAAIRSKHLPLFVEGIFLVGVFILTVIGGIVVHIVVEKRLIKIASNKFLPAKTRKPIFMNDEN